MHTHFGSTQAKPKENEEQVNRSWFSRRLTRGCSQAATTEGMRKPNPVQVEEDFVENNTKKNTQEIHLRTTTNIKTSNEAYETRGQAQAE